MIKTIATAILVTSLFCGVALAQSEEAPMGQKTIVVTPQDYMPVKPVAPVESERPQNMSQRPSIYNDKPTQIEERKTFAPQQPKFGINDMLNRNRFGMQTLGTQTQEKAALDAQEKPADVEAAKGDFSELRQMDTAVVEQVIDPLRIQLKDKRIVQLAGLDIPDFDPYEPGEIADAAKKDLEAMLKGKQVRLYQSQDQKEGRTNRMGYLPAHVLRVDGDLWVQGSLLKAGLARLRPSKKDPEMVPQMMALEEEARAAKKGLWEKDDYKILTPETAASSVGKWAIVEGKVFGSSLIRNVLYINFGSDWRTDFTIGLTGNIRGQMIKEGTDPLDLAGKTVRVRGWIEDFNGSYLELMNPVWLEVEAGQGAEQPGLTAKMERH